MTAQRARHRHRGVAGATHATRFTFECLSSWACPGPWPWAPWACTGWWESPRAVVEQWCTCGQGMQIPCVLYTLQVTAGRAPVLFRPHLQVQQPGQPHPVPRRSALSVKVSPWCEVLQRSKQGHSRSPDSVTHLGCSVVGLSPASFVLAVSRGTFGAMTHRAAVFGRRMAAESKFSDAMVDGLREKVQLRLKEMRIRMAGWFGVSSTSAKAACGICRTQAC